MSRKKRKTRWGHVQASARAIVEPVAPLADGTRWRWYDASFVARCNGRGVWYRCNGWAPTFAACIAQVDHIGFGAYTCEGKTLRLRSRYVAGDRPPPDLEREP